MNYSATCPHCGEKTPVEEPPACHGDPATVEFQQYCARCGEPVVAVFEIVYELRQVLCAGGPARLAEIF